MKTSPFLLKTSSAFGLSDLPVADMISRRRGAMTPYCRPHSYHHPVYSSKRGGRPERTSATPCRKSMLRMIVLTDICGLRLAPSHATMTHCSRRHGSIDGFAVVDVAID